MSHTTYCKVFTCLGQKYTSLVRLGNIPLTIMCFCRESVRAPKLKNYFVRGITNTLSALTLMANDVYNEFDILDYGNKTQ